MQENSKNEIVYLPSLYKWLFFYLIILYYLMLWHQTIMCNKMTEIIGVIVWKHNVVLENQK